VIKIPRKSFYTIFTCYLSEHCFGNKTIPTRVATARREHGHTQALKYGAKGSRNTGRPRKRWKDQLHLEG
jgi:hypothetical protein